MRRRRRELAELGRVVAFAVNDPKNLDKGLPSEVELDGGGTMSTTSGNETEQWW